MSTPAAGTGTTPSTASDQAPSGTPSPATDDTSLVGWLVAWGIMFALLMLLNRSRWGHAIIYYGLTLALFLLFVINYKTITALLAPASGTQAASGTSSTGTATGTTAAASITNNPSTAVNNGQISTTGTTARLSTPPIPWSSVG